MKTVYTSPDGCADVVLRGGFYRVRIRVRGEWRLMAVSYTSLATARQRADESDDIRKKRGER
jgi:hypothetical protein